MELLVRIVDRSVNPLASKYGDCIVIQPDGWSWSPEELSNPSWVLIRSDITDIEADALQRPLEGDIPDTLKAFRKYTVDLNALGVEPRPQSDQIVNIPAPALRSVVLEKT